jgi:O-antigen ligase
MFLVPIPELLTRVAGFHVPIFPLTTAILGLALFLRGSLGPFWQTPIAKPWVSLLVVFLLAAVLGDYKSMSTVTILQYATHFDGLPFFCCSFLLTTRQVRACMYWICAGCLLLLLLCATFGKYVDGRLMIPETSLANPNDLAFLILLGTTFLLLFLYSKSVVLRAVWAIAFPACIFFILKTASRANFVVLLVLIPLVFAMVSARAKIAILALAPVAAVLFVAAIPQSTLSRLTMILINPTEERVDDAYLSGAVTSQIARTELQKRAVELTLNHPLLGVGAGMFENAVEEMVRSETGQKSGWQRSHNSYLEIAAENGIPALILYVWILFGCLRINWASYKTCRKTPELAPVLGQSVCLVLMNVAYCVGIAFCNAAYSPQLAVLAALTTANSLAIQRELGSASVDQSGFRSIVVT